MSSELVGVLLEAVLFKALGGLGVFLLGMKFMSEGMQAVAGNRLRQLIGAVTNNRVIACGAGMLITCLIQSSSVTTVMVIGFVNAGFMTLIQAIGVIIGANIGTTITGWILALKIGRYGLPIIGIAAFAYLFTKRDRVRFGAMAAVGVGMVFFGLETMASGFKSAEVHEALTNIFSAMSAADYVGVLKCALVGCAATMIVQSSSATLGLTIALAQTGVIPFPTAAALILGLNIGTTITAFLASLGTNVNARRAAYAHIIFNVVGTVWLFPVFFQYVAGIEALMGWMGAGQGDAGIVAKIAAVHTGFNVLNTLVFLPFIGVLAAFVSRMVPEKVQRDTPHLTYLDVRMLDTPAIGIRQSHDEILRMGGHVTKMSSLLQEIMAEGVTDEVDERVRKVFHREEVLDVVQREVTEFLSHLLTGSIPHDVVASARLQLRAADEYESISDYLATILKLHLKRVRAELRFSGHAEQELLDVHRRVHDYLQLINDAVRDDRQEVLSKANSEGALITRAVKHTRRQHLDRVADGDCGSPLASLVFTDMLNAYRRVKDHALNIAEALADEK